MIFAGAASSFLHGLGESFCNEPISTEMCFLSHLQSPCTLTYSINFSSSQFEIILDSEKEGASTPQNVLRAVSLLRKLIQKDGKKDSSVSVSSTRGVAQAVFGERFLVAVVRKLRGCLREMKENEETKDLSEALFRLLIDSISSPQQPSLQIQA